MRCPLSSVHKQRRTKEKNRELYLSFRLTIEYFLSVIAALSAGKQKPTYANRWVFRTLYIAFRFRLLRVGAGESRFSSLPNIANLSPFIAIYCRRVGGFDIIYSLYPLFISSVACFHFSIIFFFSSPLLASSIF